MIFSKLANRLREVARAADVRKPAKPDPMIEVDKALAKELPPVTHPAFDRAAFFAALRTTDLRHQKPSQVEGTEMLLDKLHGLRASWVAYALATTWHETAATMQPIKEYGGPSYFKRMYDPEGTRPHVARALGNTMPGDGVKFAGRGYVQLTGRTNYDRAAKATGYPLVGNPDLAMRPDIAAEILRAGMLEGWFTGHKFERHMPEAVATHEQFTAARRIINGTDRAAKIADYAMTFQNALTGARW